MHQSNWYLSHILLWIFQGQSSYMVRAKWGISRRATHNWLCDFENSVFFWVGHFGFLFFQKKNTVSFPWKSVKGSWISRMGRNFDDYPGFQPKITPPKHFSRQCNSKGTRILDRPPSPILILAHMFNFHGHM